MNVARSGVALLVVATVACADAAPDSPSSVSISTTTTTTSGPTSSVSSAVAPTAPSTDGADAPGAVPTSTRPSDVPDTSTTAAPRVGDPNVASEPVGEFAQPVDLAFRTGDGALWIVEQGGRIVRFDDGSSTTALDVSDRVSTGGEQGLLGLAFSPDGSLAYVNLTDADGDTVIAEYHVGTSGEFERQRIVLTVSQPFRNHNAGGLAFGPDGFLYIPLGDGGSGGDPDRNGSNPATLLGSLLRIDPTPDEGAPYSIPADNPFANGSLGDIIGAPEVWSWGLRNPPRIAFDPVTGELWIPDVGQNRFEEINVVFPIGDSSAGFAVDFGWSAFEGTARFDEGVADSGSTTPPVLTYGHADGCAVSGGAPYRGSAIRELEPAFVYSDYCAGTIWALDLERGQNLTLLAGFEGVTAIRAGPDGELYVLEQSGTVHRLVAG